MNLSEKEAPLKAKKMAATDLHMKRMQVNQRRPNTAREDMKLLFNEQNEKPLLKDWKRLFYINNATTQHIPQ